VTRAAGCSAAFAGQEGREVDYETCYRTLGIAPGSTLRQVHRAYKRLALKHHPDRAPDNPSSHETFLRVTEAYATLKGSLQSAPRGRAIHPCRKCGVMGELLKGLDGGSYCAACLLGRRRRFLPLPRVETIRCLAVIAFQGAALYFAISSFVVNDWHHAAAAGGLAFLALCLLAYDLFSADLIER
jgi:hypothetical protein